MKEKNFLKVGEFARLCSTTKETLLHYDRKDLLKPKHIASNGYREYSLEQYFDFELICLLKEGGATLQQIKKYRSNEEDYGYLNLLRGQVSLLKLKQDQLAYRLSMLKQILELTEEVATKTFDMLFFENCEAKSVYFYKVDPNKMIGRETNVECYSNCLLDSLMSNNVISLPLGSVIPKKYAIKKDYKICYLFRYKYKEKNINIKKYPLGVIFV